MERDDRDDLHERVWRAMQRAARSLGMASIALSDEERLLHFDEARRSIEDARDRLDDVIATCVWCACVTDACPHRGRA